VKEGILVNLFRPVRMANEDDFDAATRQVSEAGPKTPSIDPAAASQTVSRLLSKSSSDNNGIPSGFATG
jgi:hypothetical protein